MRYNEDTTPLVVEIEKIEAERDRYKAALQNICCLDVHEANLTDAIDLADDALAATDRGDK